MSDKERNYVLAFRLVILVAIVYLLHAFVIADASVFNWHWVARLSFVVSTLFLFVSVNRAENG